MLKPVSCDHVTSFNYDDKKARDVGLTCWCHLSSIMPDSIFYENMRQRIICSFSYLFVVCFCFCFFVFLQGDTSVFLGMKEMESVLSL